MAEHPPEQERREWQADRDQIRQTLLDVDLSDVWLRAKVQQLLDQADDLERAYEDRSKAFEVRTSDRARRGLSMSNAERDSALGAVQRWREQREEWTTSGGPDREKFPPSWPMSNVDTARLIAALEEEKHGG